MENESPKPTGNNEKQPAKKPKWRLFRWIAKGTGALLLLAVLAWTGAYLYATYDLNSTIEELERDGYTTNLQDLARPPVHAEESTTEAYHAAFDKMMDIVIPDLYCDHGYATWLVPDDGDHPPTEEDLNEACAWVEETREVVDAFLSAGDPRLCRFEWISRWENLSVYDTQGEMEPDRLTTSPWIARTLYFHATVYALKGDYERVRECLSGIYNLALLYENEPFLLTQALRYNKYSLLFSMIDLCVTRKTGERELNEWLEFIDGLNSIEGSTEIALRGQLAIYTDFFQRNDKVGLFVRPYFRWDGADGLQRIRRCIELSQKPYSSVENELAGLQPGMTPFNIYIMYMNLDSHTWKKETATISLRLLVRTGILCELARLREGKYPDAIEGIDPLTGKSFDYSPTDGWIRTRDEELRDGDHTWKLRQAN
ncbi:MAG: hypothetical protein QF645_11280 [Planctomycetota bacterium]|nr:hypothetical protein [Planctomycetota bacterium]